MKKRTPGVRPIPTAERAAKPTLDAVQVPASALFREGSGWAVYAIEGNRARLKPVAIGLRTGLTVQVASGLYVGEQVISHPSDEIRDWKRVKLRKP